MSHIFDALQRSEVEQSRIDRSALPGVTELLQHAERREALKWETTVFPEEPAVSKNSSRFQAVELEEMPAIAIEANTLDVSDEALMDDYGDLFARIKSLPIAPPPKSRLPCVTDCESPAAEAFRLLGVRLRDLRRERQLRKVLITSTIPQEGKSMVTANLACTLALNTQEKILIIEGDLRRPSLLQSFGVRKKPGLYEWLEGERNLASTIYHLEGPGTWILPSGSALGNALEVLQSARLATLMDQLNRLFDWILIDSPPILPLADTSVWMRLADGILLTTRQGMTEKRKLQRGLEAIEPAKFVGALINSSRNAEVSDYDHYGSKAD